MKRHPILASLPLSDDSNTIDTRAYDDGGRMTSSSCHKTSESIGGTMSGYGFSVGASAYDREARLVDWQRSDSILNQDCNLSLVGDWASVTENSSAQNRTHGPTHELVSVARSNWNSGTVVRSCPPFCLI